MGRRTLEEKVAEKLVAVLNEREEGLLRWYRPADAIVVREGYVYQAHPLSSRNWSTVEHTLCLSSDREKVRPLPWLITAFGDREPFDVRLGVEGNNPKHAGSAPLARILDDALKIKGTVLAEAFVRRWGFLREPREIFPKTREDSRLIKRNPLTGEEKEVPLRTVEFPPVEEMEDVSLQLRTVLYLWERMEFGQYPVRRDMRSGKLIITGSNGEDISVSDGITNVIASSYPEGMSDDPDKLAPLILAELLKYETNLAKFETEVVVIDSHIIPVQKPRDLFSLLWKTVLDIVTSATPGSFLHLRRCQACGLWDSVVGLGDSEPMQKVDGVEYWHKWCRKNYLQRVYDSDKARKEGRKPKERPGGRVNTPYDRKKRRLA